LKHFEKHDFPIEIIDRTWKLFSECNKNV
jgi:hypothetical protein